MINNLFYIVSASSFALIIMLLLIVVSLSSLKKREKIFDKISKNRKKSISILESLKVEGTQESLILWAFSRELSNLFKVKQNGSSAELWGPKDYVGMLERMAKTTSQKEFEFAFNQIALIDACIKGQIKRNAWQALRELCLTF